MIYLMSTNATWEEKCTIGEIGENWFYNYVTVQYGFTAIATGKHEFLGIKNKMDFVCSTKKGKVSCWEVKTDARMSKTGNMFVENFDDKANNSLGWLHTTKANYMCYIDYTKELMYFFDLASLREYVDKHTIRRASCWDWSSDGCNRKIEREGYLVNVDRFGAWCKESSKRFKVDKVLADTKGVA
ncbi:MAG: hypothetical protein PHY44_01665 [Lachnospiraceae bacterium]|nr:hypothetical protein [Lachnospiraceae bacterium]